MSNRRGFEGRLIHGNYHAPFSDRGVEYNPRSARSGLPVAQSTAERDYSLEYHSVPTEDHSPGGLWDHDEERRMHGRRTVPRTPARYDAEHMAAFVERQGAELTASQWEVYTRFWVQRQSYRQIGRVTGRRWERVYETIKGLRVLAGSTCRPPQGPQTG